MKLPLNENEILALRAPGVDFADRIEVLDHVEQRLRRKEEEEKRDAELNKADGENRKEEKEVDEKESSIKLSELEKIHNILQNRKKEGEE